MQTYIQKQLIERGLVPAGMSARWIEGYMRLAYSTFSQLSWAEIRREARLAARCVEQGGTEAAERNALSFGL